MSEPIGPGDWVECVDVSPRPTSGPGNMQDLAKLRLGGLYLVAAVGLSRRGLPVVALAGIEMCPASDGFRPERFRPIYRPDETLKARLLEPLPADVEPVGGSAERVPAQVDS